MQNFVVKWMCFSLGPALKQLVRNWKVECFGYSTLPISVRQQNMVRALVYCHIQFHDPLDVTHFWCKMGYIFSQVANAYMGFVSRCCLILIWLYFSVFSSLLLSLTRKRNPLRWIFYRAILCIRLENGHSPLKINWYILKITGNLMITSRIARGIIILAGKTHRRWWNVLYADLCTTISFFQVVHCPLHTTARHCLYQSRSAFVFL